MTPLMSHSLEKAKLYWQKTNQGLPRSGNGGRGPTTNRLERTIWGGNVLYLDCTDSNATVCICPNSSNHILSKGWILLNANYISINLTKEKKSISLGIREAWNQILALPLTSNVNTCASLFSSMKLHGVTVGLT